ncbi:hypothetical protein D5H78_08785 [Vallicoccus soli]|uniref:YcaO domain-containing protein n=2 Tax=Vallicoccus soli TaxID=2339232 RepID=A0A3A3ZKV0_9ACTN|nr:hypothetical protein D5H78_08785 [Vallicoccus soli]
MPAGDLVAFATSPLDRVGVPAWAAVCFGADGSVPAGHGYGATDDEALRSTWGEAAEAALLRRRLRRTPPRRASYAELLAEVGPRGVADPLTLCLPAGCGYAPERPLDWVPFTRWGSGEEVLVPVELAAEEEADLPPGSAPPPGGRLMTLITNGLGAGDTLERAVAHGLGELLQRDGNGLRFRALDQGVVLDLGPGDCDVHDPVTREVLADLRAAGVEPLVKLATTALGVVDLYVVGDDREPDLALKVTAAGEAAHPDREVALRKAVLEFSAARARKAFMHGPLDAVAAVAPGAYLDRWLATGASDPAHQERRTLEEMVRWLSFDADELREALSGSVLSRRTSVPFADLPTTPLDGPGATCAHLVDVLGRAGHDVLVLDCSADGAAAARVVVPGLEVETMSYGRIGERGVAELLRRGDGTTGEHGLVGLGPAPEGAAPVLLTAEAHDRLGGRPWFDRAAAERVVGPLYPLYREPARHAAQLALGARSR